MINDTSKPLVFLGTNTCMWDIVDPAKKIGYNVVGVIDDDYHGQGEFQSLPVIAREEELSDPKWKNYQFFCATNWQPDDKLAPSQVRNRQKRNKYIKLLEDLDLPVASIVHPWASVISYNNHIGKGVYIDKFVSVGSNCNIGDYSTLWQSTTLAHDVVVGKNCVFQRFAMVAGDVVIKDNVYMGMCSVICRDNVVLEENTFIHPTLMLLRGTSPNEVVSLSGKDLRKVYNRRDMY